MEFPLRLPSHWLRPDPPRGKSPGAQSGYAHSVMSYTKMDVPTVEVFETAVTFEAEHTHPLAAHASLTRTFGKKAGEAFVFRADTVTPGRYWVYAAQPWPQPPAEAVSALAPKRRVIQLVSGLPYRFTLEACVGRQRVANGEKEVEPFRTEQEFEDWLKGTAPKLGFKPDFFNVTVKELRFPYGDRILKLPYGSVEGVLQVTEGELLMRTLLRGVGSYRRVGLGLLQLSN